MDKKKERDSADQLGGQTVIRAPFPPFPAIRQHLKQRINFPQPILSPPSIHLHNTKTCLQPREELGVDERRLAVAQTRGDVARHAEVGVLVFFQFFSVLVWSVSGDDDA